MGYLERNSETLKTPGFSGFDSRVSGFSRVVIFGFGSGSGSKKVGLFARVSGFRVQIPITMWNCLCSKGSDYPSKLIFFRILILCVLFILYEK